MSGIVIWKDIKKSERVRMDGWMDRKLNRLGRRAVGKFWVGGSGLSSL